MNRKILFIWNYFYFPFEKGKSRFCDLVDSFVKAGYDVEVICSSFYHMGKTARNTEDPRYQSLGFKATFVSEPGYRKNVSFARIRSLGLFNRRVRALLAHHDPVGVVYVPVPSMELASIAEKWSRRTGSKCLIDVEDLWPESFQMIIRPRWLCRLLLWPLKIKADQAYRGADAVVAVSQTYMSLDEAVKLILQSSVYSSDGQVFDIDMGQPVKILYVAEQMIRQAGYLPYKDIDIKITGLRRGEIENELPDFDKRRRKETPNERIFIDPDSRDYPIAEMYEKLLAFLKEDPKEQAVAKNVIDLVLEYDSGGIKK